MAERIRRSDKEMTDLYMRNRNTLYRVCYAYMKNPSDTEDAVMDTFLQLVRKGPAFENDEHEKAWLIRTAANICKNKLHHWWRRKENIDDFYDLSAPVQTDETFQAVMELPDKYKTVVYLYYYEGYSGKEIAAILKKPASTIRNYLHEARIILKERLGEDFDEE